MISTRYVDLGNGPLHVADLGGEGRPVVCIHGLGGSYVNWVPAAPHLAGLGRVQAVDLPGFGLTPPAGRSVSLRANRTALDEYLRSLEEPAVLVANSMGAALALLQAAECPETVERLVLVSPAAPRPPRVAPDPLVATVFAAYVLPGLARAVVAARRTIIDPQRMTRLVLDLCTARPSRIPPEVLDQHVQVAERRRHLAGIDRAFVEAARSVLAFVARRTAYDEVVAAVSVPVLVIHGREDRLVPHEAISRLALLRPDWRFELLDDVGHVAMLEVPATVGNIVSAWVREERAA